MFYIYHAEAQRAQRFMILMDLLRLAETHLTVRERGDLCVLAALAASLRRIKLAIEISNIKPPSSGNKTNLSKILQIRICLICF